MKKMLLLLAVVFSACSGTTDTTENSPTIKVIGKATDTMTLGSSYYDSGATATDYDGINLDSLILTTNLIDTSKVGTYSISYSVTNSDGITANTSRSVLVRDVVVDTMLSPGIKLLDKTVTYRVISGTVDGDVTIGEDVSVIFPEATINISNGALTIGSGAKLSFGEGEYIYIDEGAKILVNGAKGKNVIFTNLEKEKKWGHGSYPYGIGINKDAATGSIINYATIENATTGIRVDREKGLSISNSTFSGAEIAGIHYEEGTNVLLESSTFFGNTKDITTSASNLINIKNDLVLEKGISVLNGYGDATKEGTWPALKYIFEGSATITTSTITIEAGAVLTFKEDAYLYVDKEGKLIVDGNQDDSVYFINAEKEKKWGHGSFPYGICFADDAATENVIKYANFKNPTTGIRVEREKGLSISNSTFSGAETAGIYYEEGTNVLLESSTFFNNKNDVTTGASNLINIKNDLNLEKGIYVLDGADNATKEGTWPALKYIFEGTATITTSAITIEAGAMLTFKEGAYLYIEKEGKLIAEGTAADSIYFINAEDEKKWGHGSFPYGIYFADDAATESIISYANFINPTTGIRVERTNALTISNSTFTGYETNGIYDSNGSGFTNDGNNTFSSNEAGAVDIEIAN